MIEGLVEVGLVGGLLVSLVVAAVVSVGHLVDSRLRLFSRDSTKLGELGVISVASWAIIELSVLSLLGEVLLHLPRLVVSQLLVLLVVARVPVQRSGAVVSRVVDRGDALLHRPGFML